MRVRVDDVVMEFRLVRERNLTIKEAFVRAIRGQRFRPEQFRALDGVSFGVGDGSALGIIGPNGSGKTTMLRLLAGVIRPSSGHIRVDGRVTTLIDLGAGFNPDLSGEENVYLAGALYGFSRAEMRERMDRIVAFSQLERFIQVPVKNYSSGMSARLGFAIATDVDPDVLIVDEVLAVGDESFQEKCMARMESFRKAGKTIVLVSHDLPRVATFCDRAILLQGGKVRADGPPAEVISAYQSLTPA
ncbi:ABC transporter ATP-binding protein [bacterium]|nr:ABC transporter ATP-binding protein [bacterium]